MYFPYSVSFPQPSAAAFGYYNNAKADSGASVSAPSASGTTSPVGNVTGEAAAKAQSKTEKAEKKGECQTCKNRTYVDESNEGNVSFKAPGHIAPEASAGTVMAHEQQHVSNARRTGSKPENELVSASVSLKTAICPECGRSYVAGGTTRTLIKYGNTDYDKNKKKADLDALLGANLDARV